MKEAARTIRRHLGADIKRSALFLHVAWCLMAVLGAFIATAYAADSTSRSDILTTNDVSTLSSHQISLTLASGNTFAAGESVIVDFREDNGAFTVNGTGTLAADLSFNDGTARTIYSVTSGAASCAGSVGANDIAVGVVDATGVLTFLACPSYSASAATATITIKYGTAAGGTNRVTNPSSAGSFVIQFPNVAGDCVGTSGLCGIGIPVVTSGSIGVGANVSTGAPPPPPPSDTSPPSSSGITVTAITKNSATVNWTTTENGTGLVNFGVTTGYGSSASQGGYITSHSINLVSLTEATLYHFQVCSTDTSGNQGCSTDNTFTTIDETPPVITGPTITAISGTSATISWTTNEGSSTIVDYGLAAGPPYSSTASNMTAVTNHSMVIGSLSEVTTYHYRVRSGDSSGNESFTNDATFTTLDATPPTMTAPTATGITATGATISWTTNESATITIEYGTSPTLASPSILTDTTPRTTHAKQLTGLTESSTYYYRVTSCDTADNCASTAILSFQTPDATPPAISAIAAGAITSTGAQITWTTDEAANSVVEYGTTTGYGASETDAGLDTNHGLSLTGLTPFTTYHYRVKSSDASGNLTTSTDRTFQTLLPASPTIGNLAVTFITATSVRIGWTTSSPTDASIEYGPTTSYGSTVGDNLLTTGKLIQLNGLTKGATYHFRVSSTDAYSQSVTSTDQTFSTLPDTAPPTSVSDFTATSGDGEVALTWTNPTEIDFQGVRILRKNDAYPANFNDGTIVYSGTGTSITDTGLLNGAMYYYGAFAFDDVPNYASAAVATATPVSSVITPPIPTSDCGNGICATGEDSNNCPSDCPAVPPPDEPGELGDGGEPEVPGEPGTPGAPGTSTAPSTTGSGPVRSTLPPEEQVIFDKIKFYATSGRLGLALEEGSILQVYRRMTVIVYLPDDAIRKPIKEIFINFNGSRYLMREVNSYEASILTPSEVGDYPLNVWLNYQDDTNETVSLTVRVLKGANVYENLDGGQANLAGARVTLFMDMGGGNLGLFPAEQYGQQNPIVTESDGAFNFIIPAGNYKAIAEKDGYRTQETLVFPARNTISQSLQLVKIPKPILEEISEILNADAGFIRTTAAIGNAAAEQAAYLGTVAVREVTDVIDNPFVEDNARTVAAPVAVATAVANVTTAATATATAIPYMLYVYSFLAHPTLLIARRRRKKWGVVYNALTKLPVDLAIVRLIDAKTKRIIRSMVTDRDGRYFFIVPPGEYTLAAAKPGYTFPTGYMKHEKDDGAFIDIYHGEAVPLTAGGTITMNVPLDPISVEKTPRRVVAEGFARKAQKGIGLISIGAMLISAIINPTALMLALFFGNILMYAVFRRLAIKKRPRNFGLVIDQETGKPLKSAVARIFESKFNKLLETQVTDDRGRYAFLVGTNVYYVTFEKPGYQKDQRGPVNLVKTEKEVEKLVAVDVRLTKAQPGAATTSTSPPAVPPVVSPTDVPPVPPVPAQPDSDTPTPTAPELTPNSEQNQNPPMS